MSESRPGTLRPLCIIPARGGSKRLPRKNLALLAGKPLVAYAIEAARESGVFDTVCVSSEDEEMLAAARAYGADLALQRPEALAADTVPVKAVCAHVLEQLATAGRSYAAFAVLLTTNPLRTAGDIRQAYSQFRRTAANYCMSVVPYAHPPQRAVWAPKGYVRPYFGLRHMQQAQRLEVLYRHDGSVIFAKTDVFLKERVFYGTKVTPYVMAPERSVDIDSPLDLAWAEFLMARAAGDAHARPASAWNSSFAPTPTRG